GDLNFCSELILNYKCKIDPKDFLSGRSTPLFYAVVNGNTAVCELLLRHGAKISKKMLAFICEKKNIVLLDLFLSFKFDLETRITWDGLTPLLVAVNHGQEEIALIFLESGAD